MKHIRQLVTVAISVRIYFISFRKFKGKEKSKFLKAGTDLGLIAQEPWSEEEAMHKCQHFFNEKRDRSLGWINRIYRKNTTRLEEVNAILEMSDQELYEEHRMQLDRSETLQMGKLDQESQALLVKGNVLNNDHRKVIGDVLMAEDSFGDKSKPTSKNALDHRFSMTFIMVSAVILEFLLIRDACRGHGLGELLAWVFSIGLPLVIGFGAKGLGIMLAQRETRSAIGYSVVSVFALGIILFFRLNPAPDATFKTVFETITDFALGQQSLGESLWEIGANQIFGQKPPESESVTENNDVLPYTTANVMVWLMLVLANYWYFLRLKYWKPITKKIKIERDIARTVTRFNSIPSEKIQIREGNNALAKVSALKARKSSLRLQHGLLLIDTACTSAIDYFNSHFTNLSVLAKDQMKKGYDNATGELGAGPGGFVATVLAVMIVSMSSCANDTKIGLWETQYNELHYVSDKTKTMDEPDTAMSFKVVGLYATPLFKKSGNDVSYDNFKICVGPIEDTSFPQVDCRELKAVTNPMDRNYRDRKEQSLSHIAKVLPMVMSLVNAPISNYNTYLNRSLSWHLNALARSQGNGLKTLVVRSDMIQDAPHQSFEKYRADPNLLDSNYAMIAGQMAIDAPLDSLGGIDILIVYGSQDKKHDDLARASIRYWTRYYGEKGATVKHLTNL